MRHTKKIFVSSNSYFFKNKRFFNLFFFLTHFVSNKTFSPQKMFFKLKSFTILGLKCYLIFLSFSCDTCQVELTEQTAQKKEQP